MSRRATPLSFLSSYWVEKYNDAIRRGDLVSAQCAVRNAGRVDRLGVTSIEILRGTQEAFRVCSAESRAVYFSLGAGAALTLGQIGWDYSQGLVSRDQAAYRAVIYTSLIGTSAGVNSGLMLFKQGALQGTLKGNVIVGAVVLAVDTSWSLYEHGGLAGALHQPDFYEHLGGSISGLSLGIAATAYVGASTSEFGPWVAVPSGVAAGTVVGAAAYMGGRVTTSWLTRIILPDLYMPYEQQQIDAVDALLRKQIHESQSVDLGIQSE